MRGVNMPEWFHPIDLLLLCAAVLGLGVVVSWARKRRRTRRFRSEVDENERWMIEECNRLADEIRRGKKE
jgi:hypothetical protein